MKEYFIYVGIYLIIGIFTLVFVYFISNIIKYILIAVKSRKREKNFEKLCDLRDSIWYNSQKQEKSTDIVVESEKINNGE